MSGVLTVTDQSTLALSTFNLGSPSFIVLEGGSSTTGSSITGTSGILTLGGSVTVNDAAGAGNSGASISALLALGSGTRTFTVADDGTAASDLSISNTISGTGSVVKAGPGTLTYTGAFNYTGATTISAGELKLNPTTNVTPNTQFILDGGTISTVGIAAGTTITNASTLNLNSGGSVIDLGSVDHSILVAPSNGVTWNGTSLTVNGWAGVPGSSGTNGKIFVGNTIGTLTPAQLAEISFTGFPGAPIILIGTGEIVPQPQEPLLIITGNAGFGNTCIGQPGINNTYTISNVGATDAEGIIISSDNSDFAYQNDLSPLTIPANGSSTFTVNFTPTVSGAASATIIVTSTTAGSNAPSILLGGSGVNQPTASAGGSTTICVTSTYTLGIGEASSSNGTILWTENGAGSITSGATTLFPTYTPAPGDAGNAVTLTLTVSSSPCPPAPATYTINVVGSATASAGGPLSICANGIAVNITAGASASNNSGVLWSSSGTGTFNNANSLSGAEYLASAADITAGTVTLTLTAFGNAPCGDITSNKIVTITAAPQATGVTICQARLAWQ